MAMNSSNPAIVSEARKVQSDNPFLKMRQSEYGGWGSSSGQSVDLGDEFNTGLTQYFTLPKLQKSEGQLILTELQTDMDADWTPSKLVAALNKHIVSQDKAKRIIA